MDFFGARSHFLHRFASAGFRPSIPLSLIQPSITTSFLFSVGFVDVMEAIAGNAVEMDRAATVQRCLRHFDLERVADGRHLSFFEMGGALRCSDWRVDDLVHPLIRYLVEDCGLSRERLHVTYFGGGSVAQENFEPDQQAREAYLCCGVPEQNIWAGDGSTNIWFEGANSGTERSGICGPHSEVFFDLDHENSRREAINPFSHPDRFLELSNVVTITHQSKPQNGNLLLSLPGPLIELAVGMERLEMALTGATNVFEIPKLRGLVEAVSSRCSVKPHSDVHGNALRVVIDHIRALTHLIADGARPGPKGRGHVVRRFFRRLLHSSEILQLDLRTAFPKLATVVASIDKMINPNLSENLVVVGDIFDREVDRLLAFGH